MRGNQCKNVHLIIMLSKHILHVFCTVAMCEVSVLIIQYDAGRIPEPLHVRESGLTNGCSQKVVSQHWNSFPSNGNSCA